MSGDARPKGPFVPKPNKPNLGDHPSRPQKTHKGHDSLLQKLLNTKAPITIRTMTCETIVGTVVAFDAFTITIQTIVEIAFDTPKRVLFFKHAIKSIELPESFVTEARA